jgi:hypothetical protein
MQKQTTDPLEEPNGSNPFLVSVSRSLDITNSKLPIRMSMIWLEVEAELKSLIGVKI